jgi:hypothetical protein
VRTEVHNPSIMTQFHWLERPSDPDIGVLSYNCTFFQEVEKEKQRVTVYRAETEYDFKIDHVFYSTSIDTCKFLSGTVESLFNRIVSQDYFRSIGIDLKCPFKKGLSFSSINNTYNDFLLPPVQNEVRFRIEKIAIGFPKKTKKWTKLYTLQIFGVVKK